MSDLAQNFVLFPILKLRKKMACAKPPNPSLIRAPKPLGHPSPRGKRDGGNISKQPSKWSKDEINQIASGIQDVIKDSNSQKKDVSDRVIKHISGHNIKDLSKIKNVDYVEGLSKDIAIILNNDPNALDIINVINNPDDSRSGLGPNASLAIIGTANIIGKSSTASNTNKILSIDTKPRFGDKIASQKGSNLPPNIEKDTSLWKFERGQKTGIDFVPTDGETSYGDRDKLPTQIDNVRNALNSGEISNYHYVSGGKFSDEFKDLVTEANEDLSDDKKISLHQYVGSKDN